MEQKNNRSLLRSRAAKKRGNPIFVTSQSISGREPEQILEPISVNEIIISEQSSSSADLTNKRGNAPEEDSTELGTHCLQLKRQRAKDVNREKDDKCDEHNKSFVVSLPLIALEKRLDFGSGCDNNKCRPNTMAVAGEICPKEVSLSFANPSPESDIGRYGRMSIFKAFDTVFNNKWGLEDGSQETSDDEIAGEESIEKQLRAEKSNDIIGDGDDERRAREKRACKSVFDLVRLMELRRVGLVKPPKNHVKHIQFVEEIRKIVANLRDKSFSNDGTPEKFPAVNQEVHTVEGFGPIPVEDSHSTVEYNEEESSVGYSYTIVEGADINIARVTSPTRGDNEDDISYDRPILKRRKKQLNSWQDLLERSRVESFKGRLNPIAAAEYDDMEVIELDIYDELPNQLRSDVPKEFIRRWSIKDTEEFYKCIALLGFDFGRIATVMGRTQKQITNKYRTEQKKNNKRLHDAFIRQGEFFEYKKKCRC